jgi:hypothetical protein
MRFLTLSKIFVIGRGKNLGCGACQLGFCSGFLGHLPGRTEEEMCGPILTRRGYTAFLQGVEHDLGAKKLI